ncbi:hypothetical protein BKA62DRAFT_729478 [Auriculariales sp. MPI-PUGE-AT-0066]|nr:hypothetical protein BKA62DRAFT_729478 [Auriculariales sp. MPI-PUGE-AT-0066]
MKSVLFRPRCAHDRLAQYSLPFICRVQDNTRRDAISMNHGPARVAAANAPETFCDGCPHSVALRRSTACAKTVQGVECRPVGTTISQLPICCRPNTFLTRYCRRISYVRRYSANVLIVASISRFKDPTSSRPLDAFLDFYMATGSTDGRDGPTRSCTSGFSLVGEAFQILSHGYRRRPRRPHIALPNHYELLLRDAIGTHVRPHYRRCKPEPRLVGEDIFSPQDPHCVCP